ncbi:MAG: hypothetical protein R3200_11240 [Xanthomonadales bacterium]|nr:hypothetical protein [Xanthomonadales bacterium]
MKRRTPILLTASIAALLAGGTVSSSVAEVAGSELPGLEDKPPGTPGRGNPGNGNSGNGPGGNQGSGPPDFAGFAPPSLPTPPGHDRPDNPIDDGRPGLGLGRDHAPGVCEADDDFLIPGPAGQAGASHTAHVNFVGTDEAGEILEGEDAPWGRMTYFWIAPTLDFVFNGHNLLVTDLDGEPIEYTLAAELEAEDGTTSYLCLGSASVNDGGNLHILNSLELDSHLPPDFDPNADDNGDETDESSADEEAPGVGLVVTASAAIDCETGTALESDGGDTLLSIEDILYVDTDLLDDD